MLKNKEEILFPKTRSQLTKRDLLLYEDMLCSDLRHFISFDSHVLYFPVADELQSYKYLAEEKKLLLPLRFHDLLLGIFLLKGVSKDEAAFAELPALVRLCLEKIYLYKRERLDEKSGLLRPRFFMEKLTRDVQGINAYFQSTMQHDMQKQENEFPLTGVNTFSSPVFPVPAVNASARQEDQEFSAIIRQSTVGLMVLPILGINTVREVMGYHVAEQYYSVLAEKIRASIPSDAYCTLLDEDNFAILFPGASRKMMDNLAHDCLAIEETVSFDTYKRPFLKEKNAKLSFCAGYALFPQDWDGSSDSRAVEEVPYLLVHKAKITAKRLQEAKEKQTALANMQSLAYRQIVLHGGSVTGVLPYAHIQVDLGRECGAYEGMCFSVGSSTDMRKGEIILRKVYKDHAEAEVLMLEDPTVTINAGDRLFYIAERSFATMDIDKKTRCYAYSDFVNVVNDTVAREENPVFSLALMFLQWNEMPEEMAPEEIVSDEMGVEEEAAEKGVKIPAKPHESSMKKVVQALAGYLQKHGLKKNVYAEVPTFGSLGFNSILVYHKNVQADALQALYADALQYIQKKFNMRGAVGLCSYPYLNYSPAEVWESVRKALNYALLLPKPHVGILDSLAINISADRKFSLGDTFGAVEEYRMALLADTDNILAWNSLGVCLADLGRHAEAKNAFEIAYSKNNKDFTTCYNLGTTCLALEDKKSAKEFFLASLAINPDHLYARIRLGEIAEKEQDAQTAREQYELALQAEPESSVPYRALAKLFMQEGDLEKAREYLQKALHKNSEDAVSLQLLAGLYLDSHEDAQLAEMLARQSIALLPYRRAAWAELARALEMQGKSSEALEIRRTSMRF